MQIITDRYSLFQGDCLDIMKDIPDKSIDMILCDLPYQLINAKWDKIIPFCELWEQYERIITDTGAIVLFGKQPFTTDLINSNRKLFRYELIWEKDKPTNFALANKQPMCYHENILVFYKKQPIYNKQMIEREGKGAWRYNFDISHKNRTIQGTDKKYVGKKEKSNYDVNLSALKYRASEEAFLSSLTLTEWYKINVHANSEELTYTITPKILLATSSLCLTT